MFAVRVTDHVTGTDHLVDDHRYTVAKLLGRASRALCGATVSPASLLRPHAPGVCDDCAQAQAARRLTPVTS